MSRVCTLLFPLDRCGQRCPHWVDEEIDVHHGCAWSPPSCSAHPGSAIFESEMVDHFPPWCPLPRERKAGERARKARAWPGS